MFEISKGKFKPLESKIFLFMSYVKGLFYVAKLKTLPTASESAQQM
jgi:hypothetical protein